MCSFLNATSRRTLSQYLEKEHLGNYVGLGGQCLYLGLGLGLFQFRINMFSVAAKNYLHTNRLFLMLAMSSLPNILITSSTGKELNIFELKVIYTEYTNPS